MDLRYYDIRCYRLGNEYKIVYLNRFLSDDIRVKKEFVNKQIGNKFYSSISRSKSTVLGLGLCNDWEFFTTFTLSKYKYDRFDLNTWSKDFTQYIRNQRKIHNFDIKYLLVPERHKDGAWHMHGLVSGIPWDYLEKFDIAIHPLDLCRKGYRYHQGINDKFGFNSFGKIKSKSAISRYILKYVSKGIDSADIERGTHLYYSSNGLNKPELVGSTCSTSKLTDVDFKNDYMSTAWLDKKDYDRIRGYLDEV